MRTILTFLLLCSAVAFAANPLSPGPRGYAAADVRPDDFRVSFWGGPMFDPGRQSPPLSPELVLGGYPGDGTGYYLVQFDGPVQQHQVDALIDIGVGFVGFHSRYLAFARMNRDESERARALGFVRWVGLYHPGYKFWAGTLAENGYGRVTVSLFYGEDLDMAVSDLLAMGCVNPEPEVTEYFKGLAVDCPRALVAEIAKLPYVMSVQEWHPHEPENTDCQWVVQDWGQNERRIWDQGILGYDEVLGFLDTGLDANHWAFLDPSVPISDTGEFPTHRKVVAFKHYPPASGVGDPNGHGTHVAGTIAGEDSVNGGTSTHDGHSKRARIVHLSPIPQSSVNDYNPHFNTMTNWLRNPELRTHTISNSWWNGTRGQYTNSAVSVDQFSWDNKDVQIIKSCGNQGQSSRYLITEPGNSKSIISAGALLNGTGATQLASFSSRGPAPDDRIKPDICVPGDGIMSVQRNSTNGYTSMSGTSMAAPAVNGNIGLLRSYLRKGFYPSGSANAADTFGYVSAALLKAMTLVSADPNIGSYTIPSEYVGWGRMNLDSVLFFSEPDPDARRLLLYDDTVGLATGEYVEYGFQVEDSLTLRASVVWTDTAAAAGANPCLINDLDVELTAPGGSFYRGNVYQNGSSVENPADPADRLNPNELFRVENPEPGAWTLRVTANNVPVGEDQPYAVVITGALRSGSRHDVGVSALLSPTGIVDSGAVVIPACSVYNYGGEVETYEVRMRIGPFYDSTVTVTGHEPDQSRYLEFPTWVAEQLGCHAVSCSTELSGDGFQGNDRVEGRVGVGGIDVMVTRIIAPLGEVDSGTAVAPQVMVLNNGRDPAVFPVWFRIHGDSFYPDQVYEDSVVLTLVPGDSVLATFDDWAAGPLGALSLESFTNADCDANPANDTVAGEVVVVRPYHDVGAIEIIAPVDTVDTSAAVVPVALVRNHGSYTETFTVHFQIGQTYEDSVEIQLAPRTTDTVEFVVWTAGPVGRHNTACSTSLAGDVNPGNDRLAGQVIVWPQTGVSEGEVLPTRFELDDARPTPFGRRTQLGYAVPKPAFVRLAVYSTTGELVRLLDSGARAPGFYRAGWDGLDDAGRPVARGVYLCRFESEGFRAIAKVVKLD